MGGGLAQDALAAIRPGACSEHPTIFNVEERGGDGTLQRVGLDEGTAVSREPLVVLVNKNSASGGWVGRLGL